MRITENKLKCHAFDPGADRRHRGTAGLLLDLGGVSGDPRVRGAAPRQRTGGARPGRERQPIANADFREVEVLIYKCVVAGNDPGAFGLSRF